MVIKFPSSVVTPVTLGDDLNTEGGGRRTIDIENWGATCRVQEEELPEPNGGVPFLRPLGNIKGPLVFTATSTFASPDEAAIYFAGQLAMVNTQDVLTITGVAAIGVKTFSYANSILESVTRDNGRSTGVRWCIRYQFRIGAMTFGILE